MPSLPARRHGELQWRGSASDRYKSTDPDTSWTRMAGRMIGRLNHVAIAVPDLDAATATYRDTLGAKVTQPVEQTAHGVTVVFVDLGNTRIELISPLGSNSPISNFLEKHPEGGIHHVCYEVDDIAVARDRLVGSRARIGEWRARDRGPW